MFIEIKNVKTHARAYLVFLRLNMVLSIKCNSKIQTPGDFNVEGIFPDFYDIYSGALHTRERSPIAKAS